MCWSGWESEEATGRAKRLGLRQPAAAFGPGSLLPAKDFVHALGVELPLGANALAAGCVAESGSPALRDRSPRWLRHRVSCHGLASTSVAFRTENESSPENTSHAVVPSALNHLDGKLQDSPGPTSQLFV